MVFYGWNPDALIIAKREGQQLPNFNPDFVIFETTTHLVCKGDIGAEPVIAFVNREIEQLRISGRLKTILGPYARIALIDDVSWLQSFNPDFVLLTRRKNWLGFILAFKRGFYDLQ